MRSDRVEVLFRLPRSSRVVLTAFTQSDANLMAINKRASGRNQPSVDAPATWKSSAHLLQSGLPAHNALEDNGL